jgi:hypothetical protein
MSRIRRGVVLVWSIVLVTACGGSNNSSGGSPTGPTPAPPAVATTTGRVVSALDRSPAGGVVVRLDDQAAATTDAGGRFAVTGSAGRHSTTTSNPDFLDRHTTLQLPGTDSLLTLLPKTFDLASFDQMFRASGQLQRWTHAPPLTVVAHELLLSSVNAATLAATNARLSPQDLDGLIADLSWGLTQMTDNTFPAFESVTVDDTNTGQVAVTRDGTIVVARCRGLSAATGDLGYGRWATLANGTVTGGTLCLDAAFDASSHPKKRALRTHELGHALGASHVLARASVMNAVVSVEPNEADREAARVAFQRAPGNRTPDVDPVGAAANVLVAEVLTGWSPAVP